MTRRTPLLLHGVIIRALCLFGFGSVWAQQPQIDFSELERTALEELRQSNTPGAAVAVVSGEKVIFAKGFGASNIETGAPVSPDMLFRLGSTTKMFTAAALVTLADQGKIRLDEPIGNFVKGLHPKLAKITAHQLLSHTAGIRDEAPMFGLHDDSALGDNIRSMTDRFLFTEPGKVFSYSNPGYWIAGFVVQELSGKPYADAMAEILFQPLGMASTTLRPTTAMTYPISQGHHASERQSPVVVRPAADNAASWPAGSIFSSANELSRFAIAFMNGGKIDGKPALPSAVIAKLSNGYIDIPGSEERKYGYGLNIGTTRGVRLLEHGGSRAGYGSTIRMAPDHRFAVIIVANRTGAGLPKTATKAIELLLPLQPNVSPPPKPSISMTSAEMKNYVGRFSQTPEGGVELLLKDGKLFFKDGRTELAVAKVGDGVLSITPAGSSQPQEIRCLLGQNGRAEYLYRGSRALKRIANADPAKTP